jgi:hypothetical protein
MGMNPLDLFFGIGGLGMEGVGSYLGWEEGKRQAKYWEDITADSLQRIDEFRDNGQVDLQNLSDTLRPGYDALAGNWASGAQSLTSRGTQDWSNLYGTTTGNYASGTTGIQGLSGDRMSTLGGEISSLQGGMDAAYGDRLSKGMSMLEGYGDQAKRDVRQDFAESTQSELARLGSVGLGNTSAGSVMQRGMAEEQGNVMNRLNEDLAKIGLDTYSGLSGDQLASRSGLGQFGIGMMDTARAQDLSQRERMLGGAADLATNLGSQTLNAQQALGEFNLDNQVAASRAQLGEQERLAMQPFNFMQDMLGMRIGTAQQFGLPPEVVPWQLPVGQGMTNMWNVRQSRKGQEQDSGGGFQTPLFGMSW